MSSMKKIRVHKIFYDVLLDYKALKFIFEYGFNMENELTLILSEKNAKQIRELINILDPDNIYEGSQTVPWWEYTGNQNENKSERKVICNNHYRLNQNGWLLKVLSCYGNYYPLSTALIPEYKVEGSTYKPCSNRNVFYSESCNKCSRAKLCRMHEEIYYFKLLKKEGTYSEFEKNYLKYIPIDTEYKDVVENGVLRKSVWAENIFNNHEEYESFICMIQFFSLFTPMSILGKFFLARISRENESLPFIIRNMPSGSELEQEYIYRCIYAMTKQRYIKVNKEKYIPISLDYRDRDMYGLEEHLYLKVATVSEDNRQSKVKYQDIAISRGYYVEVCSKNRKKLDNLQNFEKYNVQSVTVTIDFYYTADTEYLLRRRSEGWKNCIKDETVLDEEKIMESPYDGHERSWKIDRVRYEIRENDMEGFLRYIDSFGDFAQIQYIDQYEHQKVYELEKEERHPQKREKPLKSYASLLNPYNSGELLQMPGKQLPPRSSEVEWLAFVVENYPNFCQLFLSKESLTSIKARIREQLSNEKKEKWFDFEYFKCQSRVKDLEMRTVSKYQKILKAIENKCILAYEYRDSQVLIFPYALEYDVVRHLTGTRKEPMDIMCYNLEEKRNVLIQYKAIHTKKMMDQKDITFDRLDKLYHVLAYVVRCAALKSEEVNKRVQNLLSVIWRDDSRCKDIYNRCVKKKWGKKEDYGDLYKSLLQCLKDEDRIFAEKAFGKWNEQYENISCGFQIPSDQWKYLSLLLSCFTDAYKRLQQKRAGKNLMEELAKFTDSDIWDYICGPELEGIPNEIVFFNEKMKYTKVTFVLKEATEELIDLVYSVFRNFICVGKGMREKKVRFTVTYEAFYYRRIHMGLMVLEKYIEEITPESTAAIIRKRCQNKGEANERQNTDCSGR